MLLLLLAASPTQSSPTLPPQRSLSLPPIPRHPLTTDLPNTNARYLAPAELKSQASSSFLFHSSCTSSSLTPLSPFILPPPSIPPSPFIPPSSSIPFFRIPLFIFYVLPSSSVCASPSILPSIPSYICIQVVLHLPLLFCLFLFIHFLL